jgi:hypothetical protein
LLHLPAVWVLFGTWLTGCAIQFFSGDSGDLLGNLPVWGIILLLTLLSISLTAGMPAPQRPQGATPATRTRWGLQVAALLVVFAFIGSLTLIRYRVIQAPIPLLSPLAAVLFGSLEKLGQASTFADAWNPLLSFVIPMALLLLLGARW